MRTDKILDYTPFDTICYVYIRTDTFRYAMLRSLAYKTMHCDVHVSNRYLLSKYNHTKKIGRMLQYIMTCKCNYLLDYLHIKTVSFTYIPRNKTHLIALIER